MLSDLTTVLFPLFDCLDELVLREQEKKVSKAHGDHDQSLVPHDHVVHGDDCQNGYGHCVHGAVPDQRPLFHGDWPAADCQARARWHAQRVVHAAAHHCAHAEVGLGHKSSDHGDKKLRRASCRRHERGTGNVRRDPQIWKPYNIINII